MLKSSRCSLLRSSSQVGSTSVRKYIARDGCGSNGPGVHMLADDQRKKSGVGATSTLPLSGIDITALRDRNVCSSSSCSRAVAIRAPGSGCFCFALRHDSIGSPPLRRPASVPEFFLRGCELARRNREQAIDWQRDAFFEAQLLLEAIAPEAERALGLRPDVVFEIVDVGADRLHRFVARVGEIAEQVHVVDGREGPRQVGVDERHRAAPGVDADLDEDRGRLLDVVARGLDQPRHLAQLRQDAAGAVGFGRVGEDCLRGQARRQRVGVDVRVALPRPDRFELELASADVRRNDLVLDLLGVGRPSTGMLSSRRAKPASALTCVSIAGRRKSSIRSSWT